MHILNYILVFSIPVIVGFSMFFIDRSRVERSIDYIKLFGASFFLGVIVMHLLPEVFDQSINNIGLFVAFGFFVQLLIETFTGSEPHDQLLPEKLNNYSVALLVGLGIHSFIEGFPLAHPYHDIHHGHLGETYLTGVILHKIPVISILVLMMLGSGLSRRSTGIQLILFSLMTPLGMLAGEFIEPGSEWSKYILAFVVGSVSHIAMHLIISRDINSGSNLSIYLKIALMIVGFMLVYLF